MNHALILCRSVTQAQRGARMLSAVGIVSRILRSPLGLTERGCSYSLRLRQRDLATAVSVLRQNGVRPLKVVVQRIDGAYDEVGWE